MVLEDDEYSHSLASPRPPAISTNGLSPSSDKEAVETPLEKYCSCGALDAQQQPIQLGNIVICHPLSFVNCLPHRSPQDMYENTGSGYLYSPSAPVGPTSCEYCGQSNTDNCRSNLPGEATEDGTSVCPRPKLFFLKKRPPFATPEGWNPKTGYRTQLWEPPSSVEGRRGAWGDIRGSLQSQGRSKYAEGTMEQQQIDNCGGVHSSGCGIYEESEVTCSSGGGCGDVTSEKGERNLSPVHHWVSGLFAEKL